MPGVALAIWLFLTAGRLLVSRPLVPNTDLLFAKVAIILLGQDRQLSELMAVSAALTLLVHGMWIAGFGLHGMTRTSQWRSCRGRR